MVDLRLKRGEERQLKFTFNSAITKGNIDDAVFTFVIKNSVSGEALVTINDAAFDTSQSTSLIATCDLTSSDTDRVGHYVCELKAVFDAETTFKSLTNTLTIDESLND